MVPVEGSTEQEDSLLRSVTSLVTDVYDNSPWIHEREERDQGGKREKDWSKTSESAIHIHHCNVSPESVSGTVYILQLGQSGPETVAWHTNQ